MERLEIDHEVYNKFLEYCSFRGVVSKVSQSRYLEMSAEYSTKLHWWKEVKRCIDWLYDHDMKVISRARLRNWMRKSIDFAKQKELDALSRNADKVGGYYQNTKKPKMEPIWTPPI